jgi:hypothetical protein
VDIENSDVSTKTTGELAAQLRQYSDRLGNAVQECKAARVMYWRLGEGMTTELGGRTYTTVSEEAARAAQEEYLPTLEKAEQAVKSAADAADANARLVRHALVAAAPTLGDEEFQRVNTRTAIYNAPTGHYPLTDPVIMPLRRSGRVARRGGLR